VRIALFGAGDVFRWILRFLAPFGPFETIGSDYCFTDKGLIERELVRRGLVHDDGVLVRTVHKLQGGERRVVVFSVTATEPKHLRWLASRPHLLHVAASRAQDHLVVFLDAQRARGEALLRPLVELAR